MKLSKTSLSNDTQVVIIGAGPVGLIAAINLAKNGVNFRIFEKLPNRLNLSKALAIHAGTLEYLEATHPNLLKKILDEGKKIQKLKFGKNFQIDISQIPSKYNFILALEQQRTEQILEEYLYDFGVKVERSCRLIDAKNLENKVVASFEKDSEKFDVEVEYLIDCSGAHSLIRKNILKLSFLGEKYFGKIVMGDVKINSDFDEKAAAVDRSDDGIFAIIPLNEKGFCRLILIPNNIDEIPEEISIDYFTKLTKKIAPNIELSGDYWWLTKFEISKRMTSKLHKGRIFLAGDAAHIHSPVGGQGMNLGMQDALNISSKLVRVLIHKENPILLEDYEKQRLPIIKKVLKLTNAAMNSGIEKSLLNDLKIFLITKIIAPIFLKSKFLQKEFLTTVSQIKSARQEIKWLSIKN